MIFGTYEQDDYSSNGKEEIEWLVLDKTDDRIFVVSKYGLDYKEYNDDGDYYTWETCSVRQWLNDDFLNTAFTEEEQEMIPTVTVYDEENQYGTDIGNPTEDKVFLLSVTEAYKYFGTKTERKCIVTQHAISNGVHAHDDGTCTWMLRTPGAKQNLVACAGGEVNEYGRGFGIQYSKWNLGDYDRAVRPAMWIDLSSI